MDGFNIDRINFLATILATTVFFSSCGMGFYFKQQIVGQYYLIAMDSQEQLNIARRDMNTDSYSGRVPPRVVAFGFSDSLIVAKSISYTSQVAYYIINMNNDSVMGREEDYLVGPLSEQEYSGNWKDRLNVKLNEVEKSMPD